MDRTDRIEQKIDMLDQRLDAIDKHLAIYNLQLAEHMKRTALLEEEFRPVRDHVKVVQWITKAIGAAIALAVSVLSALNIWK